MAILPKATKSMGLSAQEATIVYTFGMMAGPICTFFVGLGYFGSLRMQTSPEYEMLWPYLPSFLRIDKTAIDAFYLKGPLNLGAYGSFIMWWAFHGMVVMLLFIFMSALFRRPMLEVEGIPFPYGEAAARLIEVHAPGTQDKRAIKLVAYAFIISFVASFLGAGGILNALYPGWPGYPTSWPIFSITEKILPGSYFVIDITYHWIAMFYLLPLVTTLSGWIFYLVAEAIIIPALVITGAIQWDPSLSSWTKWTIIHGCRGWPALLFFVMGLIYASIIFGFYLSRKAISESLRAIIRSTSEKKDTEALPYRYLWVGTIVFFLLAAACYTPFGIPYHIGLFIAILMVWFQLCAVRQRGRGAVAWEYWRAPAVDYFYLSGLHNIPGDPVTYFAGGWAENAGGYYLTLSGGYMPYALECYRVGMLHNVRPREIFLVQIVTAIMVSTLVVPQILYWGSKWGLYNLPGKDMLYRSIGAHPWLGIFKSVYDGRPYTEWMGASYDSGRIMTLVGIVLGLIFAYVRTTFVWLPLDPIGFAIPLVYGGYFFPCFVAWLIKYLTIKIAGSRTYEYTGIPIAVGVAFGSIFHGTINLILRAAIAGWFI
jgi:hypothetical protein